MNAYPNSLSRKIRRLLGGKIETIEKTRLVKVADGFVQDSRAIPIRTIHVGVNQIRRRVANSHLIIGTAGVHKNLADGVARVGEEAAAAEGKTDCRRVGVAV